MPVSIAPNLARFLTALWSYLSGVIRRDIAICMVNPACSPSLVDRPFHQNDLRLCRQA